MAPPRPFVLTCVGTALVASAAATSPAGAATGAQSFGTPQSVHQLNAVDTLDGSDAWSVGTLSHDGTTFRSWIQHWDGTAWDCTPAPSPGTSTNVLSGVTAPSANDVWAVGSYTGVRNGDLLLHWNGSHWSQVTGPEDGQQAFLFGVVSGGPDDVTAVGTVLAGVSDKAIVEQFDGKHWISTSVQLPARAEQGGLSAVSQTSPTDVWAVGAAGNVKRDDMLVEHFDGTRWLPVRSPHITNSYLDAVTAIAPNDVWAAGAIQGLHGLRPLLVHWDGSTWAVVTAPDAHGDYLGLGSTGADDVWLVGEPPGAKAGTALLDHWDGSTWSQVAAPAPGTADAFIGVSSASRSDAWAVGITIAGGKGKGLKEEWNGSTWTVH